LKAIVAVDKNWGIGYKGALLERIPEDMKFFKSLTVGKVIVMGRETFESLPGRKLLPDRVNIIISTKMKADEVPEGAVICNSLEQLFEVLKQYPDEDIYVIGGASIYRQLLPYCHEVYVTRFSNTHTADAFFPNLDNEQGWRMEVINDNLCHNNLKYDRVKYINESVIKWDM